LVSSLTRRVWEDGELVDSLHNEREAAIFAAEQTGSTSIDLNQASREYVIALGPDDSQAYNYGEEKTDRTHLSDWGGVVFGRVVADLIIEALPQLQPYIQANETMSQLIADGKLA
jgi:hypothetical protein